MQAFQDARDAIIGYGQQQLEATGSVEGATSSVALLTSGLRDQMLQAGYSEAQVDELIGTLGLTPSQVDTAFNQPGMADALSRSAALRDLVNQLPDEHTLTIRVNEIRSMFATTAAGIVDRMGPWGTGAGRPEGRASGGPVRPGQLYEVAEHRTELLHEGGRSFLLPARNGHIIPSLPSLPAAPAAGTAGAGGGGVGDVHVHVSAPNFVGDPRVVAQQIAGEVSEQIRRREMATHGSRW
jgi:hypothetical protein